MSNPESLALLLPGRLDIDLDSLSIAMVQRCQLECTQPVTHKQLAFNIYYRVIAIKRNTD